MASNYEHYSNFNYGIAFIDILYFKTMSYRTKYMLLSVSKMFIQLLACGFKEEIETKEAWNGNAYSTVCYNNEHYFTLDTIS